MSATTATFRLTTVQKKYLEQQLDRVSRSFAIVIPYIEVPLRHYLATAYLLCRVVDNIEDCNETNFWKQERFAEFLDLLQEPQRAAAQLSTWNRWTWPGLSDDERHLMGVKQGLMLWQVYATIPAGAQAVVRRWTSEMAKGMSQLGDPNEQPFFVKRQRIDVLRSEEDYNTYCYYVAGTVGQLASELVEQHYSLAPHVTRALQKHADSCGRGLQKTNIIKDFVEDLSRGVCYLPDSWLSSAEYTPLELRGAEPQWKAMVLADALAELRDAKNYVLALPHAATGYRRASLLCLLPAYQTMLSASQRHETLFTSGHQIKISRTMMAQCISDSQKLLFDDNAIEQYCSRMEESIYAQVGRPAAALTS